jgi:hypothetical protein
MIGIPEALAIMSLSGVVIAAIITRRPSPMAVQSVSSATCAACKQEILTKFSEKREDTQMICDELRKQGERLARIEERLQIIAPPKK